MTSDADHIVTLLAEIERLRARWERGKAEMEKADRALRAVTKENERLRAVIVRAKDALLDGQSTQWVHDLLVAVLLEKADIERLRAALKEMHIPKYADPVQELRRILDIARRALDGEKV